VKRALSLLLVCVPAFAQVPDDLLEKAKQSVGKSLKDPYSAVYENITLGKAADGSPVVCGTVNAKNSYGAYGGRKRFYYVKNISEIDEGKGGPFTIVYEALCK
jgi:hypothetical protein